MNNDKKILKTLEDIQANIKDLQAGQKKLEAGQIILQGDVKKLHGKVDNVDLKAEAIHAYQKESHGEILGIVTDISEINGQEQKILEKRVERIEKHLELPPMNNHWQKKTPKFQTNP